MVRALSRSFVSEVAWIVPNKLLGESSSFPTATRSIMPRSTSSKLGKRTLPRTGMHVYSSLWSCGM